jgi:hypothetical protein
MQVGIYHQAGVKVKAYGASFVIADGANACMGLQPAFVCC